jgi:uroporphyrinogen-III synthase
MNIIDTRAKGNFEFVKMNSIKNIPLFKLVPIEYSLKDRNFQNVIFQSSPAVENFKDINSLQDKQIFAMGKGTEATLLQSNLVAKVPNSPGSDGLMATIKENSKGDDYLIIKGEGGLDQIENELKEMGKNVKQICCYKREKFKNYDYVKKDFENANIIIFPSKFSAEIYFEEINFNDNKIFLGISPRIIKYVESLGFEIKLLDYFSNDLEEKIKDII